MGASLPGGGWAVVRGFARRYFFLTVLPLLLVYSSYLYGDPHALAKRIETRMSLGGSTANLLDTVLAGASGHQLSAAAIAVIDLFFFGLGLGRVLQLVHARSWGSASARAWW